MSIGLCDESGLAFPLPRLSGRVPKGRCIISDAARTLGEVSAAGYSITSKMQERLEAVAGMAGLRIVEGHLVLECGREELGPPIQKFLEISKTIGDVYLVHRQKEQPNKELIAAVRNVFDSMGLHYLLDRRVQGQIEAHPFDILVPPNGRPAIAVSVLTGQNTHSLAQIWGFKCEDVRRGDWYKKSRGKLALIYEVKNHVWSDASRAILETRSDLAIPSDDLQSLRNLN
jgi:hypothetical protein